MSKIPLTTVCAVAALWSSAAQADPFNAAESNDMMCVVVASHASQIAGLDGMSELTQAKALAAKASAISAAHMTKFMADGRFKGKFTKEEFNDGLTQALESEMKRFSASTSQFFGEGNKGKAVDKSIIMARISRYFDDRFKPFKCAP
jgi:hypothetical protein